MFGCLKTYKYNKMKTEFKLKEYRKNNKGSYDLVDGGVSLYT